MKKMLLSVLVILSIIVLSGCSTLQKESFMYYDGEEDENGEYFDEYAIVYEVPREHFMIIAVRSEDILDINNDPYINYLIITDIGKSTSYSLTCGFPSLSGGVIGSVTGGSSTRLVPGEQIYEFCQDDTEMTVRLEHEGIEATIPIYTNDSSELDWNEVSEFTENEYDIYMYYNSQWIIYTVITIVASILLAILYRYLFKYNYNQYTKKEHVRKLPDLYVINIIIVIIGIISISAIQSNYNYDSWFRYNNNFQDYDSLFESLDYLEPFENDGYTLINGNDKQEIYVDVQNSDEVIFYIVFIDGNDKYLYNELTFDSTGDGEFDYCTADLHAKDIDEGGILLGYVVECSQDTPTGSETVLSFAHGETEDINGSLLFVDFYDFVRIYKSRSGFFKIHVVTAWYKS